MRDTGYEHCLSVTHRDTGSGPLAFPEALVNLRSWSPFVHCDVHMNVHIPYPGSLVFRHLVASTRTAVVMGHHRVCVGMHGGLPDLALDDVIKLFASDSCHILVTTYRAIIATMLGCR
jgi:hypothetical protein